MNRGSAARAPVVGRGELGVASMRPRFMNRGSAITTIHGADVRRASMRPRFMNRGSHTSEYDVNRFSEASMRPRFMNRGSR